MWSRRTVIGSLLGLVATLPFARRAFGASKSPGRWEEWVGPGTDVPLPPHIEMDEEFVHLELGGETHRVLRVHIQVQDPHESDRQGLGILFEIPSNRPRYDAQPTGSYTGSRRVLLPLFEYDSLTNRIVGEELANELTGELVRGNGDSTPEARLGQIIGTTRENGFDISGPGTIHRGQPVWITQTSPGWKYPKHAMAFFPHDITTEDMHLIAPMRMIRRYRQIDGPKDPPRGERHPMAFGPTP